MAGRQLYVFLSYQMEDSAARDYFMRDVTRQEPTVRFFDYPVTDSFDTNWKVRCAELIRKCHGTIVLIGRTTFQSAPVCWEISETASRGLPLIGVQLFDQDRTEAPPGLENAILITRSDISSIIHRLRTWHS